MRKKFLVVFLSLIIPFVLICSPLTALATDIGTYYSDSLTFPTSDIADFSTYITNGDCANFIIYNGLDETFYLFATNYWNNNYGVPTAKPSSKFYVSYKGQIRLYSYKPGTDLTWNYVKHWEYANYENFPGPDISASSKVRIVYSSSDFYYQSDGVTYTVTTSSNNLPQNYILIENQFNMGGSFVGSSGSGGEGEGGEGEGGSYNDSSFKSLVTDLFDHLFDVLLYGDDEDYDGTDVDDSIQWLEDLSDDMEDITDKLNEAPDYIEDGFTALSGSQTAVNDFFTGISSAVPILYYGIVGILTIIIIRKIIGR